MSSILKKNYIITQANQNELVTVVVADTVNDNDDMNSLGKKM